MTPRRTSRPTISPCSLADGGNRPGRVRCWRWRYVQTRPTRSAGTTWAFSRATSGRSPGTCGPKARFGRAALLDPGLRGADPTLRPIAHLRHGGRRLPADPARVDVRRDGEPAAHLLDAHSDRAAAAPRWLLACRQPGRRPALGTDPHCRTRYSPGVVAAVAAGRTRRRPDRADPGRAWPVVRAEHDEPGARPGDDRPGRHADRGALVVHPIGRAVLDAAGDDRRCCRRLGRVGLRAISQHPRSPAAAPRVLDRPDRPAGSALSPRCRC